MSFSINIKNTFYPLQNHENVTIQLCHSLNLRISSYTIKKQLEDHPSPNSLLSIKHTLESFGVNVTAINVKNEKLKGLSPPFIAQKVMPDKKYYFTVVYELNDETVTYFDPINNKRTSASLQDFRNGFTGVVLLAEPKDNAGEKDYSPNRRKEHVSFLSRIGILMLIPVLTLIVCLTTLIINDTVSQNGGGSNRFHLFHLCAFSLALSALRFNFVSVLNS